MNRFAIVFALGIASLTFACTAPTEEEQQPAPTEETGQSAEALISTPPGRPGLKCTRFSNGGCATLQTYCNNHGGKLWCDLNGNCQCYYDSVLSP